MTYKVLNSTTYQFQPCLEFYNYTVEYVSLYSKCYSYFESLPEQVNYEQKLVVGKWMLDVTFNTSVIKTKRIGIYITHTYAELEESLGNPSFLQFDTEVNNQAVATFKRTAVRRLPPPYDTDCLYYEQYDCNHIKTCMRHCIMNVSFAEYKSWFSRSYVKMRPEFESGWFTNRSEKEMYANCSKKFNRPPCNDYHYLAILTSEFKSEIQPNGTFQLSVAYPTTPKIEVYFNPRFKFIDMVVFFGGMFYLWTGISLLMVIVWCMRKSDRLIRESINYIFQKKQNQLQNNLRTHGSPLRAKISVISKGWTEDEVTSKPVRLNQFTSHGLATFRSP
ncbi:uncharacterized protein LOC128391239 [Panonychus citri]|uniref:uncharacterized protein LOC128391239 n=1 Tax=Panonychus citri TaxID=50023 RepID=UPI0023082CEE|nr:uncharacterized protein LOC128391239 [Panonychus citri]